MEVQNSSTTQYNSRNESDEHRNFVIVKNLKSAEQEHDKLYNRIRVLQQNDESNTRKMLSNQSRIEKLQKIKNESRKDEVKINEIKKANKQKLEERIKKNKDLKESIIKQTHLNIQNLHLKKQDICNKIVQQSKINHRKIQSVRLENIEQRRQKRDAIVLAESRSKSHILEYNEKKNLTIHKEQQIQRGYLVKKQKKKLAQIQNLSKIELQMVKKSSQSQQVFKSVKNKLDNMLGKIRSGKSQNKKKFKQIQRSLTKSESFYVLNLLRQ